MIFVGKDYSITEKVMAMGTVRLDVHEQRGAKRGMCVGRHVG